MIIAITREVSPRIGECELTHLPRHEIDLEKAQSQHLAYERLLADMGCKIRRLPAEPNSPDSVFVEDTAVVLKEMAIVTRPGAVSRRRETKNIAEVLNEYRRVFHVVSPGTLDGGDVLPVGRTLYVGMSGRTNESGIKQLADFVAPHQYDVEPVPVDGCLHLKSAVTRVGEETLLINRSWVDAQRFKRKECIDVDPAEPYAANGLLVGNELVYPVSFPRTRRRLQDRGVSVRDVDVSELQKAEGAVTCCSLTFDG